MCRPAGWSPDTLPGHVIPRAPDVAGIGSGLRPLRTLGRLRDRWQMLMLVRRTTWALMPPPPGAFASYGRDTTIVPPARIHTPECISIGTGVVIHEHSWLEVKRQDGRPEPTLVFDDDVILNRFVKIVCLSSVRLGKRVLIADRVYISDVEYLPGAHEDPMLRPTTDPAPVVIEDGAAIGVGAIIKPGVTVGQFAYVAAGSIVTQDVPPRTLAVGAPARVVRDW